MSLLDCWLSLLALGGFVLAVGGFAEEPDGFSVGGVEVAGVSLLVGGGPEGDDGFVAAGAAAAPALAPAVEGFAVSVLVDGTELLPEAAVPAVPPLMLLEPLALELPHDSEIMLTELTLRMFCAEPLMEPLVLLDAAPAAFEPLPTVPVTEI